MKSVADLMDELSNILEQLEVIIPNQGLVLPILQFIKGRLGAPGREEAGRSWARRSESTDKNRVLAIFPFPDRSETLGSVRSSHGLTFRSGPAPARQPPISSFLRPTSAFSAFSAFFKKQKNVDTLVC